MPQLFTYKPPSCTHYVRPGDGYKYPGHQSQSGCSNYNGDIGDSMGAMRNGIPVGTFGTVDTTSAGGIAAASGGGSWNPYSPISDAIEDIADTAVGVVYPHGGQPPAWVDQYTSPNPPSSGPPSGGPPPEWADQYSPSSGVTTQQIRNAYQMLLGRMPSPNDISYWKDNATSFDNLINKIKQTEEYQQRLADLNNDGGNEGGGGNPGAEPGSGGSVAQPASQTPWEKAEALADAQGHGPFVKAYIKNMIDGGLWTEDNPEQMVARAVQIRNHIDAQKPELKNAIRDKVMGGGGTVADVNSMLEGAGAAPIPSPTQTNLASWTEIEAALAAGNHGPFVVEFVRNMYTRGLWPAATADGMVARAVEIRNHVDSQDPAVRDAIRDRVINGGAVSADVTAMLAAAGTAQAPPQAPVADVWTPQPSQPDPAPTKPAEGQTYNAEDLRKAYGNAIASAAAGNPGPLKELDGILGITRPDAEYAPEFYRAGAATLTDAQYTGIINNFGPAASLPPPNTVSWAQTDAAITAYGYGPYIRTYIKNMYDAGLWKTSSPEEMIVRTVQIRDHINAQPQHVKDAIWDKIMNGGGTVADVSPMLASYGAAPLPPPVRVAWGQVESVMNAQGQDAFVKAYVKNMYDQGLWSTSSSEEMINRAVQIRDHVNGLRANLKDSIHDKVVNGGGTVNDVAQILANAGIDNNNDGVTTEAEFAADGAQNAWMQYSEAARAGGLTQTEWGALVRHRMAIGMYNGDGSKGPLGKAIDNLMDSDPNQHNRVWSAAEVDAKLRAKGFNISISNAVRADGKVSEQELADFIYANSRGTTAYFSYDNGSINRGAGAGTIDSAIASASAGAVMTEHGASYQQNESQQAQTYMAPSARSLHDRPPTVNGGTIINPKNGGLGTDPNAGNIAAMPSRPTFTE